MNRPVRSILRHAAQGYALGHIDLQEYRAFRRQVLEAILDGRPPPTVPIHWLQPIEPVQEYSRGGGFKRVWQSLLIMLVLLGVGAGAVYQYKPDLWASATTGIGKLFRVQLEGPIGDFQQTSYKLMEKDIWSNTDISRAMRTWDQLSAEEKTRARDYDWYRSLLADAEKRVIELRALEQYSSDKASLRGQADAIAMLAGALGSRR